MSLILIINKRASTTHVKLKSEIQNEAILKQVKGSMHIHWEMNQTKGKTKCKPVNNLVTLELVLVNINHKENKYQACHACSFEIH